MLDKSVASLLHGRQIAIANQVLDEWHRRQAPTTSSSSSSVKRHRQLKHVPPPPEPTFRAPDYPWRDLLVYRWNRFFEVGRLDLFVFLTNENRMALLMLIVLPAQEDQAIMQRVEEHNRRPDGACAKCNGQCLYCLKCDREFKKAETFNDHVDVEKDKKHKLDLGPVDWVTYLSKAASKSSQSKAPWRDKAPTPRRRRQGR